MPRSPNALPLARLLIRGLIVLNFVYALAIGALLVATLVSPKLLFNALIGLEGADAWQVRAALRGVVVLGILGAYVAYRVLRELLAIVETVQVGDPFIADNARRLNAIAWWVLGAEGLRVGVAALVWSASRFVPSIAGIHAGFSFTPWLAVVLLFVLARVFEEGTRMRADLAGTV